MKKTSLIISSFVAFCFALMLNLGCNQAADSGGTPTNKSSNAASVAALSSLEYDHLVNVDDKDVSASLKTKINQNQVYQKKTTRKYQSEDAFFIFTASEAVRASDNAPAAITIKFEIDRMFSTLAGSPQRKQETKYFCIPAEKADAALFDRFQSQVEELGYVDNEVFLGSLTRLLSKLYL